MLKMIDPKFKLAAILRGADALDRAEEQQERQHGEEGAGQHGEGEDGRADDHVRVLRDKEEGPLEGAVFRVKPAHKVGLRFGHVERLAVCLRKERDGEDEAGAFFFFLFILTFMFSFDCG